MRSTRRRVLLSTAAALAAWAVADLSALGSFRAGGGGPKGGGSALVSRDHRYAIIGKVRLGLFWAARDVGSARLTAQQGPGRSTFALLAGSDPERAPGGLNQWTYLREERVGDQSGILALRSGYQIDRENDVPLAAGRGATFSLSCAAVTHAVSTSALAAFQAGDITYRRFPEIFGRLPPAPSWRRRSHFHSGVEQPGFLTALGHALERDDANASAGDSSAERYLFNGSSYELSVRERDRLGRSVIGDRTYARLTRTEFAIRNLATGDVTPFTVTYEPGTAVPPIPVQILFSPSFWLKVELRLDDAVDAPADPASDPALLHQMREICRQRTAAE